MAVFGVGLAVRTACLPIRGTYDMDTYRDWAGRVQEIGLARAYTGIYFPLQWQILAWSVELGHAIGVSAYVGLRLVTLGFDIGTFLVLIGLLRRLGLDERYGWIYWISPYFVMIAWLGYVDAQIGFFVLLTLYVVARWPTRLIAAGLPLGLAFLMKPQVESVVAMVALYALILTAIERTPRGAGAVALKLLVLPAALFGAVSLYFYRSGYSLTHLANTYSPITLAKAMNSLTANMLNIWYPVADLELKPHQPIYTVTGPHVFHTIGTLLTILLMVGAAVVVARTSRLAPYSLVLVLALATMIQPMTITRAHENHFFLGGLLGSVVVAAIGRWRVTIAFLTLLTLQAAHLFLHYGFGANGVKLGAVTTVARAYNTHVYLQALLAVAAVGVFGYLIYEIVAPILTRARISSIRGDTAVS
ncbi:MAG: hypothetical protein ACXVRS_03270 [Gaiellaceae bacterium]